MNLPDIPNKRLKREQETVAFRGLNRSENVQDGDVRNAVNLSTKNYPCISPRGKRTAVEGYGAPEDLFAWDGHLMVVDDGTLYYDGVSVCNVTGGRKQWAVVNTQLCVWPDMLLIDLSADVKRAEPIAPVHVNAGTAIFGANHGYYGNVLTLESIGAKLGERTSKTSTSFSYYTFVDKPVYRNGAFDLTGNSGGASRNAGRWFIPTITENNGTRVYSTPPSGNPVGNEEGVVGRVAECSDYSTEGESYGRHWKFQYFDVSQGYATQLSEAFEVGDIVNVTGTLFGAMDQEQMKITALDDAAWKLTFDKDFPNYGCKEYYECEAELPAGKYRRYDSAEGFTVPQLPVGTVLLFIRDTYISPKVIAWDPVKKKQIGTYKEDQNVIDARPPATVLTPTAYSNDGVSFSLQKNMPVLDYICESDNRLWGVSNADKTIYASALGLPGHFFDFEGLDTDSYSVAVGSEGDFTAICAFGGGVCCWKEHTLHKMIGSNPSEYYMNDYRIEGVADHRSMSVVNEMLYYNGATGVYAYGGGVPSLIGYGLGGRITDATGGTDGLRWYLAGTRDGVKELLVYDLTHKLWTREDTADATAFAFVSGTLYMLAGEIYALEQGDDETLNWSVDLVTYTETAAIRKYYLRLVLRLDMAAGSSVTVKVREDFGAWRTVLDADAEADVLKDVNMPAKRCDRFDVRISGVGKVVIRDLARVFVRGSER